MSAEHTLQEVRRKSLLSRSLAAARHGRRRQYLASHVGAVVFQQHSHKPVASLLDERKDVTGPFKRNRAFSAFEAAAD